MGTKTRVAIRFWYSYCISAGSVCCKAVPLLNKSSNKRVIVMNTFTNVGKFSQNKIVKNTPTVSVSPTNQLSAQFPSYCRGQIKKVSLHQTRPASETLTPNGIKSLSTDVSYCHTEPLPSLAFSCNCRANFETDVGL